MFSYMCLSTKYTFLLRKNMLLVTSLAAETGKVYK